MRGNSSRIIQPIADAVMERWFAAQFYCLPDLGHLPCVEHPAGYAAILTRVLEAHL